MRLIGAKVASSATHAEVMDIEIPSGFGDLDLTGYLLLPGLINAHDHLEFNLFPRLGKRIYANATEWAQDVYRPADSPVREHRAVPRRTRLLWGGINNLLSGVTTVAHHNPYERDPFERNFPVHVVEGFDWAHSLTYAPDLPERYADRKPGQPFIIHAAEGTDSCAGSEVRRLSDLNVLGPDTVLVHALAISTDDVRILRHHACSLVFCPRSNLATYGRTLGLAVLRSGLPVALGTDSAITSEGDIRDDILAAEQAGLSREEIYGMVTSAAADILRLSRREFDFVAVRDVGQTPADALFNLHPELVIVRGKVKLASGRWSACIPGLQKLQAQGEPDVFIDADVKGLIHEVESCLGSDWRLSGRRVAQ